jgi:hypothetical protein
MAAALIVFASLPASAQGRFQDRGWTCNKSGVFVNLPILTKNNPSVTVEGAYLQVIIFREDRGRWVLHRYNTFTALTNVYGLAQVGPALGYYGPYTGGWWEDGTSLTRWKWGIAADAGKYAVGFNYRWESTGWGTYISGNNGQGSFTTCEIPK